MSKRSGFLSKVRSFFSFNDERSSHDESGATLTTLRFSVTDYDDSAASFSTAEDLLARLRSVRGYDDNPQIIITPPSPTAPVTQPSALAAPWPPTSSRTASSFPVLPSATLTAAPGFSFITRIPSSAPPRHFHQQFSSFYRHFQPPMSSTEPHFACWLISFQLHHFHCDLFDQLILLYIILLFF